MSKSNIALAIIAGAVIGGAVALILKAEAWAEDAQGPGEDEYETDENHPIIETIAQQFSERISTELAAAEEKIKSAVKKDSEIRMPEGESGVFL